MSRLLINEPTLVCQPSLAKYFGSADPAIVLQQVHFVTTGSSSDVKVRDGYRWVHRSMAEWQEDTFRWMSVSTLKRVFNRLKKEGLLVTANYNKRGFDKTTWYRVDYDRLDDLEQRLVQNDPTEEVKMSQSHWVKMNQPIHKDKEIDIKNYPPLTPPVKNSMTDEDDDDDKYKLILRGYEINVGCKLTKTDFNRAYKLAKQMNFDTACSTVDHASYHLAEKPVSYLLACLRNAVKEYKE